MALSALRASCEVSSVCHARARARPSGQEHARARARAWSWTGVRTRCVKLLQHALLHLQRSGWF